MVADLGEIKRTAVVYRATMDDAEPAIYKGELSARPYRPDPVGRAGWPAAARFICACCMSVRARVWDHCHTHGFVRAPLCNACNTRHLGRLAPSVRAGRAHIQPRHQLLPLVSVLRLRVGSAVQCVAEADEYQHVAESGWDTPQLGAVLHRADRRPSTCRSARWRASRPAGPDPQQRAA